MIGVRCALLGAAFGVFVTPGCRGEDVVLFEVPAATGGESGNGGNAGAPAGAPAEPDAGRSGAETSAGAGGTAPSVGGAAPSEAGSPAAQGGAYAGSAGQGGTDFGSPSCRSNADCDEPLQFCQKPDCTAELGECRQRDLFCEVDRNVVCGCNHVTYWNACTARRAGVSTTPGECEVALGCRFREDCWSADIDATCVRLYWDGPQSCLAETGTCWVLPLEDCTSQEDPLRWVECRPLPPGGLPPPPPICVDTCTAIRSGRPHFPARDLCK